MKRIGPEFGAGHSAIASTGSNRGRVATSKVSSPSVDRMRSTRFPARPHTALDRCQQRTNASFLAEKLAARSVPDMNAGSVTHDPKLPPSIGDNSDLATASADDKVDLRVRRGCCEAPQGGVVVRREVLMRWKRKNEAMSHDGSPALGGTRMSYIFENM